MINDYRAVVNPVQHHVYSSKTTKQNNQREHESANSGESSLKMQLCDRKLSPSKLTLPVGIKSHFQNISNPSPFYLHLMKCTGFADNSIHVVFHTFPN